MNDRLLTSVKIDEIAYKLKDEAVSGGQGVQQYMDNIVKILLEAQDAKTSKWLVEKFNQWADERIFECSLMTMGGRPSLRADELNWAKKNLERLRLEIQDDKAK